MRKLVLVVAALAALSFGIALLGSPTSAAACYKGGATNGTFGRDGLSVAWTPAGEGETFVAVFERINAQLIKDYVDSGPNVFTASSTFYAKYKALGVNFKTAGPYWLLEGSDRTKWVQAEALKSFTSCFP